MTVDSRKYEAYKLKILDGRPTFELAEQFKVHRDTIHTWCRSVAAELRADHLEEIADKRTNISSRWDRIYAECIQAFERSKTDEVVETTKEKPAKLPEGEPVKETTVSRRGQVGDPRFLTIAGDACHQILKIWGPDIAASEKTGDEPRAVGLSQLNLVKRKIADLQKTQQELSSGLAGRGGDGDKA